MVTIFTSANYLDLIFGVLYNLCLPLPLVKKLLALENNLTLF